MKTKKQNRKSNVDKYILDRTMHFGFLKTSFRIGTVFEIDRTDKKMKSDGVEYADVRDAEICLRRGWLKPYSEDEQAKIRSMAESLEKTIDRDFPKMKKKKMEVVQSDEDTMQRVITIPETGRQRQQREAKAQGEKMQVVREMRGEDIRGLQVLRQSDDNDIAKQLNAEYLAPLNKNAKIARPVKEKEDVVKKRLAERKKQLEQAKTAKK